MDVVINKKYLALGLLLMVVILAFIVSLPDTDEVFPGAYSVGYNASEGGCITHPEFCHYPLNLTGVTNVTN